MELAAQFDQALRRLRWVRVQSPRYPAPLPCSASHSRSDQCWLRACCGLGSTELGDSELDNPELKNPAQAYLNREGRAHIYRLLSAGWTLRSGWPRDWSPSIDQWLGRRLMLGHASLFSASTRMLSLVSSRMGRHGNQQPDWPRWLDGALQYAHRHHARLLIVPETTLAPTVEHFAHLADLPSTTIHWTKHTTPADWLCDLLSALATTPSGMIEQPSAGRATPDSLLISPVENVPSDAFQSLPLQDRLSLTLADNVLVLYMRPAGNLENLVARRLQDPLFPTGSVLVTLPMLLASLPSVSDSLHTAMAAPGRGSSASREAGHETASKPARKSTCNPLAVQTDWLQRGAVGWVTCRTSPTARSPLGHCRSTDRPAWQLSAPFPAHWQELEADGEWPYLVHCTRSTLGPFPEESVESFRERVWLHGDAVALHPLETLARICRERRLRATCGITRTDAPCVSFSAVPLVPLLRRRAFQVHLGRWDWEPYGLLVRQQRLIDVGAAQVIYGSQDEFLKLPAEKKPLFQPSQRKRGKSGEAAWTAEREWRVLHDVDLQSLPVGSVCAFTRTPVEAQQLAQYAPWPVLWSEPK